MNLKDYNIDLESKDIVTSKSAFIQLLSVKKPDMEAIHVKMVDLLLSLFQILTLTDNDEIYLYQPTEGTWDENGKPLLRTAIRTILPKISTFHINEILDKIRTRTYNDRSILNPLNLFGVKNGVISLETFDFKEHSPDNYITSTINIFYEKDEGCPIIVKFLSEILPPKEVDPFLEAMAYTLYPDYPFHKAFLLVGEGANGKSTVLDLLTTFLGPDSVISISLQSLGSYEFAAGDLYGKKANIDDDLSPTAVRSTGLFKRLTGNYQLTVPVKNKRSITFKNFAKFFYSMNIAPPIYNDDTHALWRRFIIFHFNRVFTPIEQDPYLIKKLTKPEELSGLLNLLLKKLQLLLERGRFDLEDSSEKTRLQFKLLSDSIQVFCQESLEVEMGNFIISDDLFEDYRSFCKELSLTIRPKGSLTKALPRLVPETYRGKRYVEVGLDKKNEPIKKQRRGWLNIKIKEGSIEHIRNILFETHKTDKTHSVLCGPYSRARIDTASTKNVSYVSHLSQDDKNNGGEINQPKVPVIQTPDDLMKYMFGKANGEPVLISELERKGEEFGMDSYNIRKGIEYNLKEGNIFSPEEGKIQRI